MVVEILTDIFFWMFIVILISFAITVMVLAYKFVVPARKTLAKYFIKAKQDKKVLVLLDNGQFFVPYLCEPTESGYYRTEGGDIIEMTPKAERITNGSVRMAIGEYELQKTVNIQIADIITKLVKEGIDVEFLKKALKKIEDVKGKYETEKK